MANNDTIDIEGQTYKVSGYADDGLPIIKAHSESTQEGFDEEGNPRISVKVTVPPANLFGTPGKVQ